jgi:8-oxo-dGTP pyrophosphatase MutT (NUDIX family)
MNIRETARVLLFDSEDRLLLMKIDDPTAKDSGKPWLKPPFWVTIGGRIEPGEDVLAAAKREVDEETGLRNVTIGRPVWFGEQVLQWQDQPTRLNETFVVARTQGTGIAEKSWTIDEHKAIVELRWWTMQEVTSTRELILPTMLPTLIGSVARGEFADAPVKIDLAAPPPK